MARFERMRKQRWGRPEALAAARRYNALAREHGLTPDADGAGLLLRQLARGQHHHRRDQPGQLDECLDAWGTTLSPELLAAIDAHPLGAARPGAVSANAGAGRGEGTQGQARQRDAGHAVLRANKHGLHRACLRLRRAWRHGSHAPAGRGPEHAVVKTLVMQDERAPAADRADARRPQVSTKNLAREIGAKSVEPCKPEVAQRHSGYLVGGTSPFGTPQGHAGVRGATACSALPRIYINGGRRGYLVGIDPAVLRGLLGARPVQCALAE
jgi:Cys-tRNA(Pro) deacylase